MELSDEEFGDEEWDHNKTTSSSDQSDEEYNKKDYPHRKEHSAWVNEIWTDFKGKQTNLFCNEESGIKPEYTATLENANPLDFYSLLVDDEILDIMVAETNVYACQQFIQSENDTRLHKWNPTNKIEMKRFIGLLAYMDLVKMPSLRHYWSTNRLYGNSIASKFMSRNRFQLLLRMWHFSDNQAFPEENRVYKVDDLMDAFMKKCQQVYKPGKFVFVDDCGKRYISRYGLKIFRLRCDDGFTWNMKLLPSGKQENEIVSAPTKAVMMLSQRLLNTGRTIVTGTYYTSLELANRLLDQNTHLLGTLKANHPRKVTNKKLEVGETIIKENNRGICIGKWRDKREILFLSTRTGNKIANEKPAAIVEYNSIKLSVQMSDQMTKFSTQSHNKLKWYKKIALDLLLQTAVVNSFILYKNYYHNVTILEFREKIINGLLELNEETDHSNSKTSSKRKLPMNTHTFAKRDGPARKTRKYCKGCYEQKRKFNLDKNKVKKVSTYCANCENEPHFCLECFNAKHKK